MYSVTVTPATPTKAYSYHIRNTIYEKEYLRRLCFKATNKEIEFHHLGTYKYYKLEDINFNITISKLYEDITATETE